MGAKAAAFLKYRFPVYAWATLIMVLSSFPVSAPLFKERPFPDKAAHLAIYGVLGFLLIRALRNSAAGFSKISGAFSAIAVALAYGAIDEWHQRFVPLRHVELSDFIFNAVGAIAGVASYFCWRGPACRQAG